MRIAMTVERLQAMRDNGMRLFATPGQDRPYWAARANFGHDVPVADYSTFVRASGYDTLEGMDDDEEIAAEIDMPHA